MNASGSVDPSPPNGIGPATSEKNSPPTPDPPRLSLNSDARNRPRSFASEGSRAPIARCRIETNADRSRQTRSDATAGRHEARSTARQRVRLCRLDGPPTAPDQRRGPRPECAVAVQPGPVRGRRRPRPGAEPAASRGQAVRHRPDRLLQRPAPLAGPRGRRRLVVEFEAIEPDQLEVRLRTILGDSSLVVLQWSDPLDGYVDGSGEPAGLPADGSGRAVTLLERDGRPMTALVHAPAVLRDADVIATVAAAVRLAGENERLKGEVEAQVSAARRLPAGMVTFLMSDIEGSTAILRASGETYPRLLAEVRRILRTVMRRSAGHEIDARADEFFAVFERPDDALTAAIETQRRLQRRSWPGSLEIRLRIGLHSGRPTLTDSGYVGLAVHATARICSAGHGGQILVSDAVRRAVGEPPPAGLAFRPLGAYQLTGLAGSTEPVPGRGRGPGEPVPGTPGDSSPGSGGLARAQSEKRSADVVGPGDLQLASERADELPGDALGALRSVSGDQRPGDLDGVGVRFALELLLDRLRRRLGHQTFERLWSHRLDHPSPPGLERYRRSGSVAIGATTDPLSGAMHREGRLRRPAGVGPSESVAGSGDRSGRQMASGGSGRGEGERDQRARLAGRSDLEQWCPDPDQHRPEPRTPAGRRGEREAREEQRGGRDARVVPARPAVEPGDRQPDADRGGDQAGGPWARDPCVHVGGRARGRGSRRAATARSSRRREPVVPPYRPDRARRRAGPGADGAGRRLGRRPGSPRAGRARRPQPAAVAGLLVELLLLGRQAVDPLEDVGVGSHRRGELEVVAVRVGKRGDGAVRRALEAIRLADDRGAGGNESLKFRLHIRRLDVPDQPAGLAVAARDLAVRADGQVPVADLPTGVRAVGETRIAEKLGVVGDQTLRILGSDQDAVEVHEPSGVRPRSAMRRLGRRPWGSRPHHTAPHPGMGSPRRAGKCPGELGGSARSGLP